MTRKTRISVLGLGSVLVGILALSVFLRNSENPSNTRAAPETSGGHRLVTTKKKVILRAERPGAFAWSADEKRVAVAEGLAIFSYDVNTGKKSPIVGKLAAADRIGSISWSSKDRLAVTVCFDVGCDIKLISLDGTVTSSIEDSHSAIWLPDGQRFLYVRSEMFTIWLRDLTTGTDEKLSGYPGESYTVLDEGRLIYSRMSPPGQVGLLLFDIGKKKERQMTKDETDRDPTVAWKEFVIFLRGGVYGKDSKAHLWFHHIPGGEEGELLAEESFHPAVSPSGRYLLCWTKPAGEKTSALTLFELTRLDASK